MKIHHIHISNFRRLNDCHIDFDEKQTILIGANNSGKTSAITALIWFMQQKKQLFSTREFTLFNWNAINEIGNKWIQSNTDNSTISINEWDELLPSLDVWIEVNEAEIYRVAHMIPSLNWKENLVGVRFRYEPKEISELYKQYIKFYNNIETIKITKNDKFDEKLDIYKSEMWDFLNKGNNLTSLFDIKYYILNSEELNNEHIEKTPSLAIEKNPLDNLIKIHSIEASRPFTDPKGQDSDTRGTLSQQLQQYYTNNIAPNDEIISDEDIGLLTAIQAAGESLDSKLQDRFSPRMNELQGLNYPGFQNPSIELHSRIDPAKAISHDSAIRYRLEGGNLELSLPEKYNGLGYQNLLSIYFKLMQFRDSWIHENNKEDKLIEPIHLVFIEEPEAHLHVQAQQVFIRMALDTLNNDRLLYEDNLYNTQLIVSTHSTHIVHEVDFSNLRYFKRVKKENNLFPISRVINLTNTFGTDNETEKFVTRYIRLNDCDIFFADAVILVEGSAERILMPHFIKACDMKQYYIAILEINGAHAHKLLPLIEKLQIHCLVITDLDASKNGKSICPQLEDNQITNNDTLKKWIPGKEKIDVLLNLRSEDKIKNNVCVAYQTAVTVEEKEEQNRICPYTFEDALAFTNFSLFSKNENNGLGLISKLYVFFTSNDPIENIHKSIIEELKDSSLKARFATDLVCIDDFDKLKTPQYIKDGLEWIKDELKK